LRADIIHLVALVFSEDGSYPAAMSTPWAADSEEGWSSRSCPYPPWMKVALSETLALRSAVIRLRVSPRVIWLPRTLHFACLMASAMEVKFAAPAAMPKFVYGTGTPDAFIDPAIAAPLPTVDGAL
jgi:hypothetical protein